MACFSCSENKSINTVTILQMYKDAFEKTGVAYWFFKEPITNEIKIMTDADFTKYREQNKKLFTSKKIEFARIDEFRLVEGSAILENS